MAARPELAARQIAEVAEAAPVVAGGVLAPARDGEILPAAVAAAGVRDHDVVAAVRQQLHFRDRRVRRREHAHRHRRQARGRARVEATGVLQIERARPRNALLQEQHRRLEARVGLKSLLHRAIEQQMGERQQDHALVMRHERADHRARLAARQARGGVVDRLVEAELAFDARGGEPLQVQARRLGRHHQRERRGVGRNDEVLGQPALQPEAGHAERAVLVVEGGVDRVVARLGHAPGNAAVAAVGDLPVDRRAARALEQRVLVRRHHQQRHQVLEHRAAPRQQRRLAAGVRQQAAEREPALLRQLPCAIATKVVSARLRGEQIVAARVAPLLGHVVADGEKLARLVDQKPVLHAGQLAAFPRQALERGDPLPRAPARFVVQAGQLAQGRYGAVVGQAKMGQLVESRLALPRRAPAAHGFAVISAARAASRSRMAKRRKRGGGRRFACCLTSA